MATLLEERHCQRSTPILSANTSANDWGKGWQVGENVSGMVERCKGTIDSALSSLWHLTRTLLLSRQSAGSVEASTLHLNTRDFGLCLRQEAGNGGVSSIGHKIEYPNLRILPNDAECTFSGMPRSPNKIAIRLRGDTHLLYSARRSAELVSKWSPYWALRPQYPALPLVWGWRAW